MSSSVPKYKRTEARVEFTHTYSLLNKAVINILMRDFGIKARSYSVDLLNDIYKFNEEDLKTMTDLGEKYNITSYDVNKYPEWMINNWRQDVLYYLRYIGEHIIAGNCTYITTVAEYNARRGHWNEAINHLFGLSYKLQEIISCINVKVDAYENVFSLIDKEINLIKGVRRSDNKVLKRIKEDNKVKMCKEYVDMNVTNYMGLLAYQQHFQSVLLPGDTNIKVTSNGRVLREMCSIVDR